MEKLQKTSVGNIRIKINPERRYTGQFVGYKYYHIEAVKRQFPSINFDEIERDGFDLGEGATNEEMIMHHIQPFRRNGYICE